MVILVAVIFVVLALSDFPKLIQSKKWYEVTVLAVMYAGVFTLAALQAGGVMLPSPVKGIQHFIVNVLHLGYPKQ
jgi:hypothetical protein